MLVAEMTNVTNVVRTAGTQAAPNLPYFTKPFVTGCSTFYARVMVLSYTPVIVGIRLLR